MDEELAGRVAIVTGGSGGIGRAVAQRFVGLGADVVVADVDAERGGEVAEDLGARSAFRRTDVADPDDVQALVDFAVDRFGGLHIMCNNAGIPSSFRRILDNDLRDLERVMAVNLYGVMYGTRSAARHMADHGGGSIINTTSMGALRAGPPLSCTARRRRPSSSTAAPRPATWPSSASESTASPPGTSAPASPTTTSDP